MKTLKRIFSVMLCICLALSTGFEGFASDENIELLLSYNPSAAEGETGYISATTAAELKEYGIMCESKSALGRVGGQIAAFTSADMIEGFDGTVNSIQFSSKGAQKNDVVIPAGQYVFESDTVNNPQTMNDSESTYIADIEFGSVIRMNADEDNDAYWEMQFIGKNSSGANKAFATLRMTRPAEHIEKDGMYMSEATMLGAENAATVELPQLVVGESSPRVPYVAFFRIAIDLKTGTYSAWLVKRGDAANAYSEKMPEEEDLLVENAPFSAEVSSFSEIDVCSFGTLNDQFKVIGMEISKLQDTVEETAEDMIAIDMAAIDLGDLSAVTENLSLPTVGSERGCTIIWESDNTDVIENDGTVHRKESTVTVTLTATVEKDGKSSKREFTVTVPGTFAGFAIEGVEGSYFYGGALSEITKVKFDSFFVGDGANGTNGTIKFEPNEGATADKEIYRGLKAEKTSEGGIRLTGQVADSHTGVNKAMFNNTYALPVMENPGLPYYMELKLDAQTRGPVFYEFGNNDAGVLQIQKTDSRVQVDGKWKDDLEQEDYVFFVNGEEKARADVERGKVTTFGIYVIPELKAMLVYKDGELLTDEVLEFSTPETTLETLRVRWNQSKGSSGVPASSYLHLRTLTLFEGEPLNEADSLVLDKEKFRFSIATDEEPDSITKNLNLVKKGIFGSKISWTSSAPDVVNPETGEITRGEFNIPVTLYAEIGPEGKSEIKTVDIIVRGTNPSVILSGVEGTYFYDNTMYMTAKTEFGDLFEGDGANGTNGTVFVTPSTDPTASEGDRVPGLYASKTDENGIWLQSKAVSAANNGKGLPIYKKTYDLPVMEDFGAPYYMEIAFELWVRDSLTFEFGKKDAGVIQIEKLDENEHEDRKPEPFVFRTNSLERFTAPYTDKEDMTLGIYVIPQLKKMLLYKNGELVNSTVLDFTNSKSQLETVTITWEHSTVRSTLMKENYLHLKHMALYRGEPLPEEDCLKLDSEELTLLKLTIEKADMIANDLNLYKKGVYGSDIEWISSDESVINPETGAVTRFDTEKDVTLTAVISNGGETVEKTFSLTVIKKGTEGNLATGGDASIEKTTTIEKISNVNDGIFETFIETLDKGVKPKITIDLGEEKLLSRVIVYERMLGGIYTVKKASIELSSDGASWKTAASTENGLGPNRVFDFSPGSARYIRLSVTGLEEECTVSLYEIEALMSAADSDIVEADMSVLKAFDTYSVTESTTLVTKGKLGSSIVWKSSNTKIIDNTGKVTRPAGTGENVTLTATVTYKSASRTASFNHFVKGTGAGAIGGNNSGGGGGGGGGGSSDSKVTGSGSLVNVQKNEEGNESKEDAHKPEVTLPFRDVASESWAYPYISKLFALKIMEGDGNGNFEPARPILREEFLKILLLAADVEINTDSETEFEDVVPGAWYEPYVNTAVKCGIVKGMDDKTFGTGQRISRQDMAVLAHRIMELKGVEIKASGRKNLTDMASVSDYARESVQLLADAGIISGNEYSIFNPEGDALREQAAKIICLLTEMAQ